MKWKSLKQKTWFKILTNRYIFVLLVFTVWMLFFDTNSWLTHQKLNDEINEIENNINYYKSEIEKDKKTLKTLKDSVEIEKFARETYFMKRENEDVFIIKYEDSLNK
ncbi:septum formation initiator family protein [Flavobacterium sp. CS20]|jgi:cell division protein FtsB|uniref:septum formation initiator family protein n=1 Tax=Flavobacterium sp. CS20 TaxID=2775246 RepID=UPI001B3A0AD0|nr:septum formation initiator family protein [Flavobacterium sp. CS20]QTY27376.1 septum formation initiator family protein [Flavobacterium sp. CS20]